MHNLKHLGSAASLPLMSPAVQAALQSWEEGLLDWLPVGIYTCDKDGALVRYNRRAAELWGWAPAAADRQPRFCGAYRAYRNTGEVLLLSEAPMSEVLRTGKPVRDREVIVERPDGSRMTILANLDPLFGLDGEIVGGVSCFQDISARKRAEERLRESERQTRDLLEALPAAVYTTDAAGRITFYNEAAVELSGRRPELGSDEWCVTWQLYWPDGRPLPHDQCPMAVALKENRPVRGEEAVAERPDGTRVPFMPYPTPLRDASGALVGAVNMLVDITERKRAQARQDTLLDELNHRVKNTLATVQALAAQTVRGAGVPHHISEAFESRLLALSKAHDQLSRGQWESADFKSIVEDIFAPYRNGNRNRVRLEGEPVELAPKVALTLAMVLHELAANAATYGSLAASGGALRLSWRVAADGPNRRLRIAWEESGGPPVQAPKHDGFGTRLMERGIKHELKGSAEVAYDPAGLCCSMDVPLSPIGA
jgi:PAS domain S-box-containing protein